MLCFADAAVKGQYAEVKIASANPGEHGFYKHMGFEYSRAIMESLTDTALQGGVQEAARLYSILRIPDGDEVIEIQQIHLASELLGSTGTIRSKSEVSVEKAWEQVGVSAAEPVAGSTTIWVRRLKGG